MSSTLFRQRYKNEIATNQTGYRGLVVSHFSGMLWVDAGEHEQATATIRLTREEVRFLRDECDEFLKATADVVPVPIEAAVDEEAVF